ncbi:cytoskeletal protein RodZ [Streptosporangium becharense]|uniref:Cytoskeletal protein RodZ n=1 Tax=Streptosporangium becharense TaxID=1816182 RepID=A0A7W9IGA7_9ACTN|nr:hypothetical protein [Streptosporangium becharense]MBB2908854.1 cytoskeletal protein RodZ [Streptosporangium becharense]MBB5820128.1 cytoskeletal protein RodZ [Streptosporangium becharense]
MGRSLKAAHVLLVAAFAAGVSGCSGEGGSSAATPTAAASSATVTAPPAPAAPTVSESATETETAAPAVTPSTVPADPTAGASGEGDGAGDTGPAVQLVGTLSATLTEPGWITVQLDGGDAQPVMLNRDAPVLDVQGTICDKGKVPHKCTVAQLEKALRAGKAPYAKVTLRGGVAVRVEELVRE